jgi:hypothetical protein
VQSHKQILICYQLCFLLLCDFVLSQCCADIILFQRNVLSCHKFKESLSQQWCSMPVSWHSSRICVFQFTPSEGSCFTHTILFTQSSYHPQLYHRRYTVSIYTHKSPCSLIACQWFRKEQKLQPPRPIFESKCLSKKRFFPIGWIGVLEVSSEINPVGDTELAM